MVCDVPSRGSIRNALRSVPGQCGLRLGHFQVAPSLLSSETNSPMPIAFKEWAVTVRALAEGEQLVTLRKGGIREPDRHFSLDHERFFLYPTFDHQRRDLVRESHQPELRRALEEGVWPDGGISQPDRVRIRAWAEVAAAWTVTDQRTVDALTPFHVWTTDYAEKRLL